MLQRTLRFSLSALVTLCAASQAFADGPLTNVVSRWLADGDATDSIGDNDGTLTNGATFAPGIDGQAFSLNGTDQWIEVPSDASLRPGDGSFSATTWFRRSGEYTFSDQATPLLAMADGDFDNGWFVGAGGTNLSPVPSCGVDDTTHTGTFAGGTVPVPIGTWAHIACVYDAAADTLTLFINGARETTVTAEEGPVNPSSDLYIGRYRRSSIGTRDEVFPGLIDNTEYFARVISDAEVADEFIDIVPLLIADVDCNEAVNSTDALKTLRHSVQLTIEQTQPCPRMADLLVGVAWGDVDCSGDITATDALKVLRTAVGLEITQDEPCVDPGEPPLS